MNYLDEKGTNYLWLKVKHYIVQSLLGLSSAITSDLTNKLSGKVDKIDGKGLSTNDYTTDEKNKLSGIESGANKTIIDSVLNSTSTNPVQNKVINSALAEKVNTNDSRLTNARPASDVSTWAKATTKPSYSANEVGALPTSTKYAASSSVGGSANSAEIPSGFSGRASSLTWGNQTGTYITSWSDPTGGNVAFRRDNPKAGLTSMIIDGTVYVNEGSLLVAVKSDIPTSLPANGGTASNVSGVVAIANGGTGATSAAAARTNLGLGSLAIKNSLGKTDIGLGNVDNTADANKSVKYATSAGSAVDLTARNTANGALLRSGGTMTGDITFQATGTTGTSNKISFSGSTDGASIYYNVPASDQGNLVLNTVDDANCYIQFAASGKVGSYISPSDGIYHGNVSGKATSADNATTWAGLKNDIQTNNTTDTWVLVDRNGSILHRVIPADAKFTDTNTWRGIQNNLTSTSTTDSLSAAQGKVLNDKIANIHKQVDINNTSVALQSGVFTRITTTSNLTLTLGGTVNGQLNLYEGSFNTGATAPTITWPTNVQWGNADLKIEANKHYEFSIRNDGGTLYGIIYSW